MVPAPGSVQSCLAGACGPPSWWKTLFACSLAFTCMTGREVSSCVMSVFSQRGRQVPHLCLVGFLTQHVSDGRGWSQWAPGSPRLLHGHILRDAAEDGQPRLRKRYLGAGDDEGVATGMVLLQTLCRCEWKCINQQSPRRSGGSPGAPWGGLLRAVPACALMTCSSHFCPGGCTLLVRVVDLSLTFNGKKQPD